MTSAAGVDTDAIIMVIAARSNKQRQEIAQKYQTMYEKVTASRSLSK